jgi:DedD protein
MDRRVKERLIGASILLGLVVVIVPELLPDPEAPPAQSRALASAPEPVRNITVDLATSQATASAPAAAEPVVSSAEPVPPVTEQSAPAAPVETAPPAPTSAAAAAQPAATSAATAPPPANSGRWAVQLGSFASRANADKLAQRLKSQGFSVYVLQGGSGNSLRYRVRMGPMADHGAAAQVVDKLKSSGYAASLVPPTA